MVILKHGKYKWYVDKDVICENCNCQIRLKADDEIKSEAKIPKDKGFNKNDKNDYYYCARHFGYYYLVICSECGENIYFNKENNNDCSKKI